MAAKPPLGSSCVHCLATPDDLTWDHLPAKSWYPASDNTGFEKWCFPACLECNSEYGRIEDDFIYRFGMTFEPGAPFAGDLAPRALRSMNPAEGRTASDAQRRGARLEQFWREIIEVSEPPDPREVLPGFGVQLGREYDEYTLLPFDPRSFALIVRKLAKGFAYIQSNVLVDPALYRTFFAPRHYPHLDSTLAAHGHSFDRGTAIQARRAPTVSDPVVSMLRIELWRRLKLDIVTHSRASAVDLAKQGWQEA